MSDIPDDAVATLSFGPDGAAVTLPDGRVWGADWTLLAGAISGHKNAHAITVHVLPDESAMVVSTEHMTRGPRARPKWAKHELSRLQFTRFVAALGRRLDVTGKRSH